jgi:hypothetical protein
MYDLQRVLQMYCMTYTDSFGESSRTDNCFQTGKLPLIGENFVTVYVIMMPSRVYNRGTLFGMQGGALHAWIVRASR